MSLRPPQEHAVPIAVLALFLLNSPFTSWWSRLSLPWYAIFLPWLLLIVLVWLSQRSSTAVQPPAARDDETRR